jgi:hypothetical protein
MKALEKELKTYKDKLPELLADEGKYVLIHEGEVAGTWDTYEDALKEAYLRYKKPPFLVKKIESIEQVYCFTRSIGSCHP